MWALCESERFSMGNTCRNGGSLATKERESIRHHSSIMLVVLVSQWKEECKICVTTCTDSRVTICLKHHENWTSLCHSAWEIHPGFTLTMLLNPASHKTRRLLNGIMCACFQMHIKSIPLFALCPTGKKQWIWSNKVEGRLKVVSLHPSSVLACYGSI